MPIKRNAVGVPKLKMSSRSVNPFRQIQIEMANYRVAKKTIPKQTQSGYRTARSALLALASNIKGSSDNSATLAAMQRLAGLNTGVSRGPDIGLPASTMAGTFGAADTGYAAGQAADAMGARAGVAAAGAGDSAIGIIKAGAKEASAGASYFLAKARASQGKTDAATLAQMHADIATHKFDAGMQLLQQKQQTAAAMKQTQLESALSLANQEALAQQQADLDVKTYQQKLNIANKVQDQKAGLQSGQLGTITQTLTQAGGSMVDAHALNPEKKPAELAQAYIEANGVTDKNQQAAIIALAQNIVNEDISRGPGTRDDKEKAVVNAIDQTYGMLWPHYDKYKDIVVKAASAGLKSYYSKKPADGSSKSTALADLPITTSWLNKLTGTEGEFASQLADSLRAKYPKMSDATIQKTVASIIDQMNPHA